LCREFLGVFAGLLLGLAEAVVFAQVTVGVTITGDSHPDARGYQAVGLTGGVLCHDREDDLSGMKVLQAFLASDELSLGRKDGGDANQVLGCNPGVAKCQFKRSEAFFMSSSA